MPLELKIRGKSTTQSYRTPIYYVDLVVREGITLAQAVTQAKECAAGRIQAGIDQQALDDAARLGFANGVFDDLEDEVPAVAEELFPEKEHEDLTPIVKPEAVERGGSGTDLKHKLSEQQKQTKHRVGTVV